MQVLYIIPKRKFFRKKMTGSVSHALGILNGLIKSGIDYNIAINRYEFEDEKILNYNKIPNSFFKIIPWIKKHKQILVRYSFSNLVYIFFLSLICRILQKEVILELNSLYALKGNKKIIILFIIELCSISLFNHIQVVSPKLKHSLPHFWRAKTYFVPNGSNMVIPATKSSDVYSPENIVYLGSYQNYYNFDQVKLVCSKLNLKTKFIGNTKNNEIKWDDVKDSFNHQEISELINPAKDILILPYKQGTLAEYGFPMKISEYLSLNSIIISSRTGVLKELFGSIDVDLTYDDGDSRSLQKAIIYALKLDSYAKFMIISKYHNLSIKLNWEILVKNILGKKEFNFGKLE